VIAPADKARFANLMDEQLFKYLMSIPRAEEASIIFLQRKLRDQKVTEGDIHKVTKIFGNHIADLFEEFDMSYGRFPDDKETEQLVTESIDYAFKQFEEGK
jgi:hypothetical protein